MTHDIHAIIKQLTLEEKAGMCSGTDFWHLQGIPRLNISSAVVFDGPHGLRKQNGFVDYLSQTVGLPSVCFPAACATASSFDRDLLRKLGEALGEICRGEQVAALLGPGVNIKRSPLCGRNFEYFSEDPIVAGELAASYIQGVQSKNVGTALKHFAVNNQEYRRFVVSAEVDEQTLREIYLPAFEIAVKKAQPALVMCSYNQINGVQSSENAFLLNDVLRDEWGFKGFVVSDWSAVKDRVNSLNAGLDLEMPSTSGITNAQLVQAVNDGRLSEAVLDRAVERILSFVLRTTDNQITEYDKDAMHALAITIEEESAVLLKNDFAVLPLTPDAEIAFIGEFAETPRIQGGGSSHITPHRVISALDAVQQLGAIVKFACGFRTDDNTSDTEALLAQAVQAAKNADVAVVFAGLPDSYESEGGDRAHMRLPDAQNALIAAVCAANPRTVVVLHNGSPVEMPWAPSAAAILELYLGGEGTGEATANLLFGWANPSGHLAETFPLQLEDNPSYLNFPGTPERVRYAEGIFVGYRYYDKKNMTVRFPFGHGLSYTTFAYSNLRFDKQQLTALDSVTVWLDVTNTGSRAGKEVVQIYVREAGHMSVMRPEKELKDFAKIALKAGETKTVTFTLPPRAFEWYHTGIKSWWCTGGTYEIFAAKSSRDIALSGIVTITQPKQLPFTVHKNTVVGDVAVDPRTKAAFEKEASAFAAEFNAKRGEEVLSVERITSMLRHKPFRCARNSFGMTEARIEQIIEAINEAIARNSVNSKNQSVPCPVGMPQDTWL
jgi:beta-glucosidase